MPEFKCISCGAIKESEKQCGCPVCGYLMFETPYDKADVLKKEILKFISGLRVNEVADNRIDIYRKILCKKKSELEEDKYEIVRKSDDDKRFPDFSTIQGYVCASTKTEVFYERINNVIDNVKKHIHELYLQEYQVSLNSLKAEIEQYDSVLKAALAELEICIELPEPSLPELVLKYTETPNEELLGTADKMLADLALLSDKIKKFIRQNNIYGTAYRKEYSPYKPSENSNYSAELEKYSADLSKVLAKKYVVDIFSDGSDEMGEMLKAMWGAIEAILTVPVLLKKSIYTFDDSATAADDEFKKKILERINRRYLLLDNVAFAYDFLADRTDEQLFDLYNKLIELDSFGILGINKNALLKIGESEKKLNEMIGLSGIKESIKKIKAYALANKDSENLNIHMCFLGNPGSGKTEVARYIAGILYENKILPTKKIVEVDRSGLVSQYFGATAEKTSGVIARAMGGVLFIDEAYTLGNNSNSDHGITDYGKEAIDTLVKAMEDYRGKFCVILAGYRNEMLQMLSTNPGFKSRIQFTLDFPNYSRDELKSITELMLKNRHYTIGEAALNRILDITDVKRKEPNYANAREIRNILDQVVMCQNLRCVGTDDKELGLADVNKYILDAKINLPTSGDNANNKILTGEEELDQLVGLDSVKRMVRKIKAYAKRNKGEADFNIHMCFYGNPGTGKTEVARIISRILYDAGVLDEAKLVETDGHGLLGKYVGETAPKTEAKVNDAMNGVLFIDEAYSLSGNDSASHNYGDEAIAVLLKAMEDHRGQFCVILAGYKEEMKRMLSTNPGFESRIQFTLEFPDYSREELGEIAGIILKKKKYDIKADALERLLDITEYYRQQPNFANARTVRNILDQVLMNQNLRTEDTMDDKTIVIADVEDYIIDEGIDLSNPNKGKRTIGFL